MIVEVATGRRLDTRVVLATPDDIRSLGPDRFDWSEISSGAETWKLVAEDDPATIQGLIALEPRPDYLLISLLQSHPENVGRRKRFDGVAGSPLAFAAFSSFELGLECYLALDAKTALIEHYRRTYGAQRIGASQRLFFDTAASRRLITTYYQSSRSD